MEEISLRDEPDAGARAKAQSRAEWRVLCAAGCFVGIGGFAWGLMLGAVSGALSGAAKAFDLSARETGLVVALMGPGELVGSAAGGVVGDVLGRRAALVVAAALVVVGSLAAAAAPTLNALLAARLVCGVGAGASYVAQLAWASELAPRHRVGGLTTVFELSISLGYVATFAAFAGELVDWRGLFALPAGPAAFQLLLVVSKVAPESPRWLATARGEDAAKEELVKCYARFGGDGAAAPVDDIASLLKEDALKDRSSLRADLHRWRWPSGVFVGLTFLTFFSGGFNLRLYVVAIYRAAGLGDASARRMTLALGLVKFATTLAMILKIDGLARRPLLLGSLAATVVLAAALAAIFGTDPDGAGPVVVVACLLYTAAFQVGFGTLNFLLLGEVFPPRLKGRLVALQQLPAAAFKFASQYAFALALAEDGLGGLFGAHAVVAALGLAFNALAFPETRGKSPEAVRADFEAMPLAACCGRRAPPPGDVELRGASFSASDEEDDDATLLAVDNPIRDDAGEESAA